MATLLLLRCWEQTLNTSIWHLLKKRRGNNRRVKHWAVDIWLEYLISTCSCVTDKHYSPQYPALYFTEAFIMFYLFTCSRSIVCLMYMHSSTGILGDTAVETKSNRSWRRKRKITLFYYLFFFLPPAKVLQRLKCSDGDIQAQNIPCF